MSRTHASSVMPPAPVVASPWYRHRWPWLLMLGPAIVVAAGFWTLWVAVDSDDGLVADDYYKRGLAINRTLERAEKARALGLNAIVELTPDGAVRATLTAAPGAALPAIVQLSIVHPTRAGLDRSAELVRGPEGSYVGRVSPLEAGRWRIGIETAEWRLPAVELSGEARSVRLDPGPASGVSTGGNRP